MRLVCRGHQRVANVGRSARGRHRRERHHRLRRRAGSRPADGVALRGVHTLERQRDATELRCLRGEPSTARSATATTTEAQDAADPRDAARTTWAQCATGAGAAGPGERAAEQRDAYRAPDRGAADAPGSDRRFAAFWACPNRCGGQLAAGDGAPAQADRGPAARARHYQAAWRHRGQPLCARATPRAAARRGASGLGSEGGHPATAR